MDDHPALQGWHSAKGELLVGGVPLTRLARRVGQTPFFAYDRARLEARVGELRAHLPEGLDLHYAIKANPMAALVCFLAPLVDGFDVASAGELTTALDAGMPADRMGFAGPGKTDQELVQALAAGVLLEVESAGELARLETFASDMGVTPRIALRINPDFQLKGSGMRMGGGAQQFGIDAEDAPRLIIDSQNRGLEIQGFHIFAGSRPSGGTAALLEPRRRLRHPLLSEGPAPGSGTGRREPGQVGDRPGRGPTPGPAGARATRAGTQVLPEA